jgi:hypothetical protein
MPRRPCCARLALEPLHQDYIDAFNVDVLTEVARMRDSVRSALT